MSGLRTSALFVALLPALVGGTGTASAAAGHPGACTPSPVVLKAERTPVHRLSSPQVQNASEIINAAAPLHVPERGQTLAVMTALEASSLGEPTPQQEQAIDTGTLGLFGPE